MTREEAIETIRRCCPKISDSECDFETAMRFLIPELAESEDERIRKALIEAFKKKLERGFEWVEYGIPNRSVLDWLEKQKPIDPDMLEEFNKGFQEAIMWGREGYKVSPDGTVKSLSQDEIDSVLQKQKEQKPAEWSEEDKTRRNCCMIYLTNIRDRIEFSQIIGNNAKENSKKEIQKDIDWLKSLPERFVLQPKPEWSEEDEKYLNRVINLWVNDFGEDSDTVKWLKSLKPYWKPSEEQMKALESCGQCNKQVYSLYLDLKKL